MKLLGSTEKVIDKDKNGENVPKLEIVDEILMHCNVVNNSNQQASKVLTVCFYHVTYAFQSESTL